MRAMLSAIIVSVHVFLPGVTRAEDFYAGKTITLSTFASPGGSYDTYLRFLSQHLPKYIAGKPSVIVSNQPGAGGFVAANYAGRSAPQDGTYATLMSIGIIVEGVLGSQALRTPLQDFNWIGNFTKDNNIIVTSEKSPIKTLFDAQRHEVVIGSLGVGSIDAQLPTLYNELLGTKFKLIYGYGGTPQILAAMERGEVDGHSNIWATLNSVIPQAGASRLNVILQIGATKDPALPNTPLLSELVIKDQNKARIAEFMALVAMISRPLAAPPNVPPDRIRLLRRAFDQTLKDPEFLSLANRSGFNINPMTGEQVQEDIGKIIASPSTTIESIRQILAQQMR